MLDPTHPVCHSLTEKQKLFLLASLAPTHPPQNIIPPRGEECCDWSHTHPEILKYPPTLSRRTCSSLRVDIPRIFASATKSSDLGDPALNFVSHLIVHYAR